jgi:hypothetical protein
MTLCNEIVYQNHLQTILNGSHFNCGIFGVTDITTEDFHAEIKIWTSWKQVLGQLLAYNKACPKLELRAYFYGKKHKHAGAIVKFLQSFNINSYHLEIDNNVFLIIDLLTNTTCKYFIEPETKLPFDRITFKSKLENLYQIFFTTTLPQLNNVTL